MELLLTASVAAAFQGEYALCQTACALHSPALLAELGINAAWLQPGEGMSRRGTRQEAVFHPDTLRKLLCQIARLDREAGRRAGQSLLDWWNGTAGGAFIRRAGGGTGVWILDPTKVLVNLENGNYEGSEVAKDQDGKPIRGYKLGLLSVLIDVGRLIGRVNWDGVRAADVTVALPLVRGETPLSSGDKLLEDRGLIDGQTISCLKQDLKVDSVFPLKSEMLAYRLAVFEAEQRPHRWQPHPTRKKQEIQGVKEIGRPWETCTVPLNGCVVREWDEKRRAYEYFVFATTDLDRSPRGIIQDYEARSECEEDHRQLKGRDWEMDEFTATSQVEILYHVLMVLFAYNLCQLYGYTEAGQRFAGKTKRARLREQRRQRERYVVIVAPPYYAVLSGLDVTIELLAAEGTPRRRLLAMARRQKAARTTSD